jgi:two-component system nitrogen regulation sensor histidine kinase GlnL
MSAFPLPIRGPRPWARAQLRWRDVLASISDGVMVLDLGGTLIDLNPAAEQLLGVGAPQVVGAPVEHLAESQPGNAWLAELARATVHEGVARRRAEDRLRVRGQDVLVSTASAPVHDEAGVRRGAVIVLHDLTLEQQLDTATRRVERFASLGTIALGLAHEIRNPLSGIKGAAQLLRANLGDPAQVHATDIIIREVDRLDGLLEELRGLSSPPPLQLGPVNIHRILNDVLALQRQAPEWGAVILRTEFDPSLPAVLGDPAQLTQVFLNLVKNAAEALDGGGTVTVLTRIETRYHVRSRSQRRQFLSVIVADDGPGVPEHIQHQLFSPFFTTKSRGTGLGLAVCHRIVSEHGGTIAHEPRPGGGARFRVTLPVSEDHADTRV